MLPTSTGFTGRNRLRIIRGICRFYAAENEHYVSRDSQRNERTKTQSQATPVSDDDEISLVWDACDQLGTFGRLVKVALLTRATSG